MYSNFTEIKKVLHKFQEGYTKRDLDSVEEFVQELFIDGRDTCVLGTGTGELFLGVEQIKALIKNDWEYWGDVYIDLDNVHINIKDEIAWFTVTGTVKYSFQFTEENYISYLNFIKEITKKSDQTPKQKVAFINWVLSLAYHHRINEKREYFWPMGLSGVLLQDNGKWKFTQMQFSMVKSNFPDERFENSKEHMENYNNQNLIVDKHFNGKMDSETILLLNSLETELFDQNISNRSITKYFTKDMIPSILAPNNQLHLDANQIMEFFCINNNAKLALDFEHAIFSKRNGVTWVTACGLWKVNFSEEELFVSVLNELDDLIKADFSVKDKLFSMHRSVSYAIKEGASGQEYTCPIRLTAVIINEDRPVFQNIHFSFPFYWILEGKL